MDSETRQKELYKMSLLEQKDVGNVTIQRVTGGWIYWKTTTNSIEGNQGTATSCSISGVFVPAN